MCLGVLYKVLSILKKIFCTCANQCLDRSFSMWHCRNAFIYLWGSSCSTFTFVPNCLPTFSVSFCLCSACLSFISIWLWIYWTSPLTAETLKFTLRSDNAVLVFHRLLKCICSVILTGHVNLLITLFCLIYTISLQDLEFLHEMRFTW